MNLILNDGPHPFLVDGHFVKFIDLSSLKISNLNMGRIVCIEGKNPRNLLKTKSIFYYYNNNSDCLKKARKYGQITE